MYTLVEPSQSAFCLDPDLAHREREASHWSRGARHLAERGHQSVPAAARHTKGAAVRPLVAQATGTARRPKGRPSTIAMIDNSRSVSTPFSSETKIPARDDANLLWAHAALGPCDNPFVDCPDASPPSPRVFARTTALCDNSTDAAAALAAAAAIMEARFKDMLTSSSL